MASLIWAKTIRCDWPECTQQATIELVEKWPERILPKGWTDLSDTPIIAYNGQYVRELCPAHSIQPIKAIPEKFGKAGDAH